MNELRYRGWHWLAMLLLLMGAVRLLGLLLHSPLIGYANQYDQVRAHACLGLWPAHPGPDPAAATPAAPIEWLKHGAVDAQNCHRSTDVLIAQLAWFPQRLWQGLRTDPEARFSLRWVGALKAVLLLVVALWLDRRLRQRIGARLVHAAAFALVLADPLNTLFLHTLYSEFGALLGAYALLGVLVSPGPEPGASPDPHPHRTTLMMLGWGALALALSRFQHLPVLLALTILLVWRHGDRQVPPRRIVVALLLAALGLGVASHHDAQQRISGIPKANRADTLFGALLPASSDPARLLQRLGLPATCIELNHSNWYLPRGRDLVAECAPAFVIGHARIAAALLQEPGTAFVALARALPQSTAWRLNYVGEVAGGDMLRLEGAFGWSLADPMQGASHVLQFGFWLLPMSTFPVLLGMIVWRVRTHRSGPPARDALCTPGEAVLLACALIVGLGWLASVLGDGYSELARHLHLAINAACVSWLVLLAGLCNRRRRAVIGGISSLSLAALLTLLALQLPLPLGRITQPALDTLASAGPQRVRGWVLSPEPPQNIELCAGSRCSPARVSPSAAVGAFFPIDGGRAAHDFEGELDLQPGPLQVWLLQPGQPRQLLVEAHLR